MLGDIVEELEPEIDEGEELEIDECEEMEMMPRFPYVAMHPVISRFGTNSLDFLKSPRTLGAQNVSGKQEQKKSREKI